MEERTSPQVWCEAPGGECHGGYMKIWWNNPNRVSRWSGSLAITLYVNGDYVRTDYFTVS